LHAHHAGVVISLENTNTEMGDPQYLRSFVDETRLTGLRFNFDIGHAHLADGPEDERIAKSFAPMRELIAGVHLHDNHAEKDEHLAPYDGTIDWPAAIALLKTVSTENIPLTLELKEKTAPDAPGATEQLDAARQALDKFEEHW
jgi:sugar phosphate isomerase/epimerase